MKYKLLLVGKNASAINDFFVHMDSSFECLSSSLIYTDIIGHIKYFEPDALVFCMNGENKDNITTMISVHFYLQRTSIPFILFSDQEDLELFKKLHTTAVDYIMHKPMAPKMIEESLLKFLNRTTPLGKRLYSDDTPERTSVDHAAIDAAINEALNAVSPNVSDTNETGNLSAIANNLKSSQQLINELEKEINILENPNEKKRVMIIDDSPAMLKAIKEHLKTEYEIATAINGKIGLRYLQNKKVDLILLDYEMPEMDGPEVFKQLLDNPDTANIPVVFLTGINDTSKIQKALSLKPQGYLLKPVDRENLMAKIHEILD